MIQYDDGLVDHHVKRKKYTRWINMLSDSLLHRTLLVFLLKCLVQPIWEMFIYIYMYIYLKLETTKQTTVILGHQTLRFYLSSQYLARKTIDCVMCFTGILPIKSCMVRLRMKLGNDIGICPIFRHTLISAPYSYTPWRFIKEVVGPIITPKSSVSSYLPHSIAISWVYPMLLDKTKWSR